jgi:hypothetical protein
LSRRLDPDGAVSRRANPSRVHKLSDSEGIYGLVVMAPASVVPSGGTPGLLLERDVQVAALRGFIEAARSGGGRFAVIEGSAGIGKTRLLVEARAIAGSAGMRVLAARGGEFESRCSRLSLRMSARSCSQGRPR